MLEQPSSSEVRSTSGRSASGVEAMFRLDGKVTVVTGASSGLGERFARVLTDAGARVIVVARRSTGSRDWPTSSTAQSPLRAI